jgi:AraC-like DNA-binding protein
MVHLRGAFADADGEHRTHSGIGAAPEHFGTIVAVARAVEVGVGIYEQANPPAECGSEAAARPVFFTILRNVAARIEQRMRETHRAKLIAMVNVKARPRSPRLLPFIKSFHYHEAELSGGLERIVPTGQAHLMVNLAEDEFLTYDRVRPERMTQHRGAVFAGPHAQSTILDTRQFRWLVAVEFRPGGAGHFLGIPAGETCNQVMSLGAIWRSGGDTLRERLLDARMPQEGFAVLEELLLKHLDLAFDPAVASAVQALERGARVSEVASRLGMLPRTLERRFTAKVGLTPKRYARVRRLQRVMGAIRNSPDCDWSSLAAQYGYCDQSHLVHEFRELADITPSEYKPHSRARNNHIPLPAK